MQVSDEQIAQILDNPKATLTRVHGGERMVLVRSRLDGFRDNGKIYMQGDEAHMEVSMAVAAISAGQVELILQD